MHDFAEDSERAGEGWELDGGPLIEGVDYEEEWLKARAAANALNSVLGRLGLSPGPVRVQAGWAADGQGVVHQDWTPEGTHRLVEALERLAERGRGR